MDKDTHHIRIMTQHIVRRAPYDNAGTGVRNMADGFFLRRDSALYRVGCEVQFPHNDIFIGIDAGNKFLRQTAFLSRNCHQLFIIAGDIQFFRHHLSNPLSGGAMLSGNRDNRSLTGRPDCCRSRLLRFLLLT